MKMTYSIVIGIAVIAGISYYLISNRKPSEVDHDQSQKTIQPKSNHYLELREQIFKATPIEIGIITTQEEKPYAIVMDINMGEDGTATLVSVIDGNASMYLSSGGGVIGGYAHETVRNAAIDFVTMGQQYFSKMNVVDSFPLPKTDNVRFYILTNKAKYSIEDELEKIESNNSTLSELFYEGNNVITALRLTTEQ